MNIPTEPIGSIPRPEWLVDALNKFQIGAIGREELQLEVDRAVRETVEGLEATRSPVITDGEQGKPSFATYPVFASSNIDTGGVNISFADGHTRTLPVLTRGPFRYSGFADRFILLAKKFAKKPLKQAVISPSALSLLYPPSGIAGYEREDFLCDLVDESYRDIKSCFDAGAHCVQVDFTEARLSLKLDPSGTLLKQFIDLNNLVFERFPESQRKRLGVHTCPGGDCKSTHSADVDYANLLPSLLNLRASNFYVQLASEPDRQRVLRVIGSHLRPDHRIFVGVVDPLSERCEKPEEICELLVEAARFINPEQLGTTDDCGFAPFADDTSRSRELAFSKIRARVEGTQLASDLLGR
jgi:5-methyltetrahydropteroyltriglutamate--homocysteine methyltransferase